MVTPIPVPGIGRNAAARLARAELSRPVYHRQESLTARVVHAVLGLLGRVFRATGRLPGGWWTLVALAALAVIAVTMVLAWTGPVVRARRHPRELAAPGGTRSARDHRDAARRFAEEADYGTAICETVRAIAAELDERGVLLPRAGRTADEFAAEAGEAIPRHAARLRGAALLFDEIRYGHRPGTPAGYQRVRDLDVAIQAVTARMAVTPRDRTPAAVSGGSP